MHKKIKNLGMHLDPARHLVLSAAHSSPLSAHNGFLGCRHFSKANVFLKEHHIPEIDWTRV
jgi:uracil-DNA glycosylase